MVSIKGLYLSPGEFKGGKHNSPRTKIQSLPFVLRSLLQKGESFEAKKASLALIMEWLPSLQRETHKLKEIEAAVIPHAYFTKDELAGLEDFSAINAIVYEVRMLARQVYLSVKGTSAFETALGQIQARIASGQSIIDIGGSEAEAQLLVQFLYARSGQELREKLQPVILSLAEPLHKQAIRTILPTRVMIKELGRGAFGRVIEAEDLGLNRKVAIKELLAQRVDQEALETFRAEAKLLAKINHPNVVMVFQLREPREGGEPLQIIMECVEGISLFNHLGENGPLPLEEVIEIAKQSVEGLKAAGEAGIVHRDIKPENLLMIKSEKGIMIKITDFGISELSGKVVGERINGTPHYISPEAMQTGKQVDPKADLYSLACTLFELLTGKTPFEAQTIDELLQMHFSAPFPKVRELLPNIPALFDELLRNMAAKDPGERPAHDEILSSLRKINEELKSPKASAPEQPREGDKDTKQPVKEPTLVELEANRSHKETPRTVVTVRNYFSMALSRMKNLVGIPGSKPITTETVQTRDAVRPQNPFWKDMSWARNRLGNSESVQRGYIQEKTWERFCEEMMLSQHHFYLDAPEVIECLLPGVEEYLEPIRTADGAGIARLLEAAALICSRFDLELDRVHRVFPHFAFIDGKKANMLAIFDKDGQVRGFPVPDIKEVEHLLSYGTSISLVVNQPQATGYTFFQRHNIDSRYVLIFGCDVPVSIPSTTHYNSTINDALRILAAKQALKQAHLKK
ncbi:MAG: serine/threonine protein kinase [Candidatus Margulisbacteria bacterium]|nr:serine/threonine protein kinase [Candidatus Margulisiibacteriota bacterium]